MKIIKPEKEYIYKKKTYKTTNTTGKQVIK